MNNLLAIISLHYIADWGLQSQFVSLNKGKYWEIMFSHCMVWAGAISLGLMYLNIFTWWKFLILFVGHYAMDSYKCKSITNVCSENQKYEKHNRSLLRMDQGFHLLQCIIVSI